MASGEELPSRRFATERGVFVRVGFVSPLEHPPTAAKPLWLRGSTVPASIQLETSSRTIKHPEHGRLVPKDP
jgi:hypothetical protein